MNLQNISRGIASIRLLLDFGAERGVATPQLLRGSLLSTDQLADPRAELSAGQELRVIENLLRALGHPPGLGLEIGCRYRFPAFGLWGLALVSSPTLGTALETALKFVPLTFAFSRVGMVKEGDDVILAFHPALIPPGLSRFTVERDMAAAATLLREIGGESFRLKTFSLQGGRGRAFAAPRTVETIAGVLPEFDGASYSLSFAKSELSRPLPGANPTTHAMCEGMCADMLERRRTQLGTAAVVRQYLSSHALGQLPSLAQVATLTSTGERTLKRRLQREGTSFRTLVAEVRADFAAELVREQKLPLSVVADRLGYADLSSFSQAFKRWHGVAPMVYRQKQR